jgi:hypothetical protein
MEHGSHSTKVIPNQPHRAGFAAAPGYSGASFKICLTNDQSLCLQSNGPGNQVTITSNKDNWSVFTKQYIDNNGTGDVYNFENANGNCLRENNSNEVVIANGRCLASDIDARWVWPQIGGPGGSYTDAFQNDQYPTDDMLVHGNMNGYKVWAAKPVSGDWIKWIPPG